MTAAAHPHVTVCLDLVRAIADVTDDEGEIVATVLYLLRSRRVRLIGSFRGETL